MAPPTRLGNAVLGMQKLRPRLTSGAEPIVTAARFLAGATKVRPESGGVRRRDAAARSGRGQDGGGLPDRELEREAVVRRRLPKPTAMSTKQVTCRSVRGAAGSQSAGSLRALPRVRPSPAPGK